ncbi:MAG: hypothetical protein KGJ60_10060 [Verrucomicrobiota bacterium]|nr:hypothetical protein [Verrucomicrobiota bacterium]
MNSNTTGVWLVIAGTLSALVLFLHLFLHPAAAGPKALLPALRPAAVTGIRIIPSGAPGIDVERVRGAWQLTSPFHYPAQAAAIEGLLDALQQLAPATFDGQPAVNGERIPLGNHTFDLTNPKADAFSTNLFVWYGPHNLGEIELKRSMGTLSVQATPPAPTITITGPEFSTTLYDCAGTNLTVPTDQYTMRAEYPHWSQTQNAGVLANLPTICAFAPRFGALCLTCNEKEATFRLESADGQAVADGSLPATLTGLPTGEYVATVSYPSCRWWPTGGP